MAREQKDVLRRLHTKADGVRSEWEYPFCAGALTGAPLAPGDWGGGRTGALNARGFPHVNKAAACWGICRRTG